MNIQGSNAKYVELSNQAYGVIVDTFASAMRGRLNFWKSVWQIASRPYTSTAMASIVEQNVDRASELTNLTVAELQSRVQRTADFSQKFLAHVGKLQDAARETYRDVSTVDRAKDVPMEMSRNGVSTDVPMEVSRNGVSTDASTDMSGDGFKYREVSANPVSVTNEEIKLLL